jgi:hypothetical protein
LYVRIGKWSSGLLWASIAWTHFCEQETHQHQPTNELWRTKSINREDVRRKSDNANQQGQRLFSSKRNSTRKQRKRKCSLISFHKIKSIKNTWRAS